MVSQDPSSQANSLSPRISFSTDFLDDANFICISPNVQSEKEEREKARNAEFEFLSSNVASPTAMLSADELFFQGKLLPFRQKLYSEKLNKICLKTEQVVEEAAKADEVIEEENNKMSWFIDEDPSPRPPKCTVLWKELLRLKKQGASSSSSLDLPPIDEGKEGLTNREKHVKRVKKGLERTRSASIRIRPVVNVPVCTQGKSSVLPPLPFLRRGRLYR